MGSYYIPRNAKGESRILYIFTVKALISTIAGLLIGFVIYLILSMVGLKIAGIVIMVILGVLGYGIGIIKIPTLSGIRFTKKIGGEPLSEIILRYIKFKKNNRKYTYFSTKENSSEEEE